MNDHCAMYETLTIEEKLLIDADMKKWFAESIDLCLPISIYKVIEIDFIERLKRKEASGSRTAKTKTAGRRNNRSIKHSDNIQRLV